MPLSAKLLPIVTRQQLIHVYDPFFHGSEKALLRSFRQAKVLSPGRSRKLREPHGRVSGTLHLYSGLNLDSIRLYRRGGLNEARQIASAAGRVEERPDFDALVNLLSQQTDRLTQELRGPDVERLLANSELALLMRSSAAAMEAVRQSYEPILGAVQTVAGVVIQVQSSIATIETAIGAYRIPVSLLTGLDLGKLGSAVVLQWELIEPGGSVLSTAAAIPDQAAGAIMPFGNESISLPIRSRRAYQRSMAAVVSGPPPLPLPLPD